MGGEKFHFNQKLIYLLNKQIYTDSEYLECQRRKLKY